MESCKKTKKPGNFITSHFTVRNAPSTGAVPTVQSTVCGKRSHTDEPDETQCEAPLAIRHKREPAVSLLATDQSLESELTGASRLPLTNELDLELDEMLVDSIPRGLDSTVHRTSMPKKLSYGGTFICATCGDRHARDGDLKERKVCIACEFFIKAAAHCTQHSQRRKGTASLCELGAKDLRALWKQQKGRCFYSGVPMEAKGCSHWQASAERLDIALGYVHGNVVLVALEFNTPPPGWSLAKIAFLMENMSPSAVMEAEHVEKVQVLLPAARSHKPKYRVIEYKDIDSIPSFKCNDCSTFFPVTEKFSGICRSCFNRQGNVRYALKHRLPHSRKAVRKRQIVFRAEIDGEKYVGCNGCETMFFADDFPKNEPLCRSCLTAKEVKTCETLVGCCSKLLACAKSNITKKRPGRAITFSLVKDDLIDLYEKQNGKCFYSGLSLVLSKGRTIDWRASLERLSITGNYENGNCVLVCSEFNASDQTSNSKNIEAEGRGWTREKFQFALMHMRQKYQGSAGSDVYEKPAAAASSSCMF